MKYYTEALVNDLRNKKKISAFFLGDWRRTSFYQAKHRTKDTFLLWIEGMNFGRVLCYPCVLVKDGEEYVFENSSLQASKDNNAHLVEIWKETIDPKKARDEFDVSEVQRNEFNDLFKQYRKSHLEREIAKAEEENAAKAEKDRISNEKNYGMHTLTGDK